MGEEEGQWKPSYLHRSLTMSLQTSTLWTALFFFFAGDILPKCEIQNFKNWKKWFWRLEWEKEKENSPDSYMWFVYHIEGWLKMCTWFLIYSQIWLDLSRDDCHFLLHLPTNDCHISFKHKFLTKTLVVVDHGSSSLEGKPHYESCLKNHCHVPRVNPIVVSFMCTQSSIVHLKQTIACF